MIEHDFYQKGTKWKQTIILSVHQALQFVLALKFLISLLFIIYVIIIVVAIVAFGFK